MSVLFFLIFFLENSLCQSNPKVCLDSICFTGSWITTNKGLKFASFQGIKYGQDPVGKLRFKPPQVYQYNQTMVDVSSESKVQCPQFNFITKGTDGEEDCLLLNIYVPNIAIPGSKINTVKLPVMVWIHGGSFLIGSGKMEHYNPTNFMDTQSVVIVTMNYRLGPLGFLSLGNKDVPGNAGLRDQSMALAWVKEQIASFGGDDKKITVFGESAGASSIALHLLSPLSKGLFHRAILQSTWAGFFNLNKASKAVDYAKEFSMTTGCNQVAQNEILSCLQELEVAKIMTTKVDKDMLVYPWTPVLDYDFTPNPYLESKNVEHCFESGNFNTDLEIMIGTTADEGIFFIHGYVTGRKKWEDLKNNIETEGASQFFNIANKAEITSDVKRKIHQVVNHYIGSKDNIDADHLQGVIDMYTDTHFLYGTQKLNNYLVKQGIPVYQYILTYEGQNSLATIWLGLNETIGVCHTDDLFYLWDYPTWNLTWNKADKAAKKTMTQNWINFATTGNPDMSWNVIGPNKADEFTYWNISSGTPIMTYSQDIKERMEIWNEVLMNNSESNTKEICSLLSIVLMLCLS